jgi:IS1 family transposase
VKCPKCGSETYIIDNVTYHCCKCEWEKHADDIIHELQAKLKKTEVELEMATEKLESYRDMSRQNHTTMGYE